MPANTPLRGYTYPCYTDGTDFPDQMEELATDIDTDIDNLVDAVALARLRPLMRARIPLPISSGQLILNNVLTPLVFQTETFDTDAFITVPGSNITFPVTGLYLVSCSYLWDTHDAGRRRITFQRTAPSAAVLATTQGSPGGEDLHGVSVAALIPATAGDVMQVQVFQNTSVSLLIGQVSFNIVQVS